MRTMAIGDVHGYSVALDALIEAVGPRDDDQFVFLGDYVDKGPDPKGVIERLLAFDATHRAVFLRGNHDQMMVDAHRDPQKTDIWETLAGNAPLASYSHGELRHALQAVPEAHWKFLEVTCRNYFETPEFIFVHGGIRSAIAPHLEDVDRLLWTTLAYAAPHFSGRTVICGHSAQKNGVIADFGHTICVDTAISHGGWLTCLDVDTSEFWQANARGDCRTGRLRESDGLPPA